MAAQGRSRVFYHLLKRNPDLCGRIMEASPFLSLPDYLNRTGAAYDDVMEEHGFDPGLVALGQIQNRFRIWLEAAVNGYDYGLDGVTAAHPGRFTAGELDCATLEFYMDKLVPRHAELSGLCADISSMRKGGSVEQVAAAAARFYSLLPSLAGSRGRLEKAGSPPAWKQGSAEPDRHIGALFELLRKQAPGAFDLLVLHGSFSTRDYAPGCSDLDTFAILNAEVASSASEILKLRTTMLGTWEHFFRVDPFQHHGLMLAAAQDTEFYAPHFFPLELLPFSKTVVGGGPLEFWVRDTRFDEAVMIHQILYGMMHAGGFEGEPVQSAKRRAQMVLLLPALLLMYEGKRVYKRDSFSAIADLFEGDRLPAIDACSFIRARNMYGSALPPGGKAGWLESYKRSVLDAPPQPVLAQHLEPLAGQMRELATLFAARVISQSSDQPHIQSAFEWTDEPVKTAPTEYQAALKSISAKITAYDGVSVLSQGNVSAPGISDLDLIIAINGPTSLPELDEDSWKRMLDESERYLCAHMPFMVPDSMLDRIGEIWPVSGLQGSSAEPDWGAHLFTVIEIYALMGVLSGYPASFALGRLKARTVLLSLHSMTYTLKILRAAGSELDTGSFEADVQDLRQNWFNLKSRERRARLLCLWADSLDVHLQIVETVSDRISAEIEYPDLAHGTMYDQVAFVKDWSPRVFLECAAASIESKKHAYVLPVGFLLAFCLYERAGGAFSRYLSDHTSHNVDLGKISCSRAKEFYSRAQLLGEATERLHAMSVPRAVLPTFADDGKRPDYSGFWHSALQLAMSGGIDKALSLAGRYDRMHEAYRELADRRKAKPGEFDATTAELRQKEAELEKIRGSLTFRMLRKYDATLGKILPTRRPPPHESGAGRE